MEKKERKSTATIRKSCQKGSVTQVMVNFRCDLENLEWLKTKANKGRYINELIKKDREGES